MKIDIFNSFIQKFVLEKIKEYDYDDRYTDLQKGDITEIEALDNRTCTVISFVNKMISLRFECTNIEKEQKMIKYTNKDYTYENDKLKTTEINKEFKITVRGNYGYIKFLIDNETDWYLLPNVVDRPIFSNSLEKLQNLKIKSFDKCGIILKQNNPKKYKDMLNSINKFIGKITKDYHPFSENKILDIIHPSMYPYVKGKSNTSELNDINQNTILKVDYWNRQYEDSKYQWLPSEFHIDKDGKCSIDSYINNLPEEEHNIKIGLESLFSEALPHLEDMWSYINTIKLYDDGDQELYGTNISCNGVTLKKKSLKNKNLQVITKIVRAELKDNKLDGAWHVEGMSHENIVATAVFVLDQSENIKSSLYFKRRFTMCEAASIINNSGQNRPEYLNKYLGYYKSDINCGLVPLGCVNSKSGTMIVFPNSHIHKIDLESLSVGSRTIVVFWLVNPDVRIISTKHIERQQGTNKFTNKQALDTRLKLMKERKYYKQNFNVRDLNLCEH